MSIDMSQFHAVFFEESFEGLEIMETGLLNLDLGAADLDTVNDIFRAAHSIKGGSGTFGFSRLSEFTHVLETLLDEIREGKREVTRVAVEALLQSVDCLREMLHATKADEPFDEPRVKSVHDQLESIMGQTGGEESSQPSTGNSVIQDPKQASSVWLVNFHPHASMLRGGNDPIRLLRELGELADLEVVCDLEQLPAFDSMDPETCHLGWQLKLTGEVSNDDITEVFSWVDDECDLEITPTTVETPGETQRSSNDAMPTTVTPVAAPANRRRGDRRAGSDRRGGQEDTSIRVSTSKVDVLINLVGELVITQSMLSQVGQDFVPEHLEQLIDGLGQLERNTRELQENVMQIRMLPLSFSFNRFPRLVHDLSMKLGKKVELKLTGEGTEVDKTVLEKISDPLVHLIRNSLDHGLEDPQTRLASGKTETGTIELRAFHEGGNILIEVVDDGAGLNTDRIREKALERGLIEDDEELTDERIQNLIFQPGFSTADQVSDVSGRGVGMDVVRRNITDVGGSVSVRSERGVGSTFTVRLPLTLAILDGQLVRVGEQRFVVPLLSIVESLQVDAARVSGIAGQSELYKLRDEYIPVVRLYDVCNIKADATKLENGLLVIVEADGKLVGLFVDDLLGQQQVVIKSLETNFRQIHGLAGATILGDGKVALILDVAGLVQLYNEQLSTSQAVA